MYKWFKKYKEPIRLTFVYILMTLAVITIVTFVVFFVMGYRFNLDDGRIEQYAFLQFNTSPTGATVTVDGHEISSKTPTKTELHAGSHQVTMSRDGYEPWTKTVDAKAGVISWLNYGLLIPNQLNVETIASYDAVAASLASPDNRSILIQSKTNSPIFTLIGINSDPIKSTNMVIAGSNYSQAGVAGVDHGFEIIKWDDNGRYVLIKHAYGAKSEWLVLDTQDATLTKNITKLLNITINDISFAGTGGNNFYALDGSGDVRRIDLAAGTISKPLVSGVINFTVYKDSILAYVATDPAGSGKQIAGIYRDGDASGHTLRTATTSDSRLQIATTHYFKDNYVAIAEGKNIDILSGNYPTNSTDSGTSMKTVASYSVAGDVANLSFSPTGEYVLVRSGAYLATYDLEYNNFKELTIDGGASAQIKWLDNNYLWSDAGGNLSMFEFDGANKHVIDSIAAGQAAALTDDAKYIYSIGQSGSGYQLQRVRILN